MGCGQLIVKIKKECRKIGTLRENLWAHLGSNQGPPDYESGALTN